MGRTVVPEDLRTIVSHIALLQKGILKYKHWFRDFEIARHQECGHMGAHIVSLDSCKCEGYRVVCRNCTTVPTS